MTPLRLHTAIIAAFAGALLLGFATTILVALTCAAGSRSPLTATTRGLPATWPLPAPSSWPAAPTNGVEVRRGNGCSTFITAHYGSEGSYSQRVDFAGWPFFAFYSSRSTTTNTVAALTAPDTEPPSSVRIPTWMTPDSYTREFPLRPLWPGLVGDTVLYALPWMIVCAARFKIRAIYRRLRGRCGACGYQLLHGSTCPECGAGK